MFKKFSTVFMAVLFVALAFATLGHANAETFSDLTVTGDAHFQYPIYADGGQLEFGGGDLRIVDFNQGGSRIFDQGDMHIVTDDNLYFDFSSSSGSSMAEFASRMTVNDNLFAMYPIYARGGQIVFDQGGIPVISPDGTPRIYRDTGGNLRIMGNTLHLDITNDINTAGNLTVGGDLAVSGTQSFGSTTFSGAVTIDSTLGVTGNTTLTGDLVVNGGNIDTGSVDLTIEAGTSTAKSLVLISDEDTVDAINIDATAGGIDIDVVGGTGQDISLTNSGGSIKLRSWEAALDSIHLASSNGGIEIGTGSATYAGSNGDIMFFADNDISMIISQDYDIDVTDTFYLDTAAFSINSTGTSNITTVGGNLTVGTSGAQVGLISTAYSNASAVKIATTDADGGIDIDAGTAGIAIDQTGAGTGISLDAASASNFTTSSGALTLTSAAATTWSTDAGVLALQGNGGVDITATTGTLDLLATAGNITATATTLAVTGAQTISSTLGVTGTTTLTGALAANGGITVDTNAFTVADTSGNTTIAGTFDVDGATTLDQVTINTTDGEFAVDGSNRVYLRSTSSAADAIDLYASAGGISLFLGGGDADDFLVDTDALVVESDNDRVGIRTSDPDAAFEVDIADNDNVSAALFDMNDSTNNPDAVTIENAGTGDSLVITHENLSSGSALLINSSAATEADGVVDINAANTTGKILSVTPNPVTATGTLSGASIDMIGVSGNGNNVYGIWVESIASPAAGNEYGMYLNGTGWDYSLMAEDNVKIGMGAAPTADILEVSNFGQATLTDGVDGMYIGFYQGSNSTADDENAALNIFASTAGDADDAITGIKIQDLTNTGAGEGAALVIGDNWDFEIEFTSTSPVVGLTDNATLNFVDDEGDSILSIINLENGGSDSKSAISADAYRVTNGTAITTTSVTLTKTNLQAASHWKVNNAGDITISLMTTGEQFDSGDVGRKLTFGMTGNATSVTFAAGAGSAITVSTIQSGVGAMEDTGDWAECLVTSATQITCTTFGQD